MQSKIFKEALESSDHEELLDTAIFLIEGCTTNILYMNAFEYPSLTNLPVVITELPPRSVYLSQKQMKMEYHGGFAHFGFGVYSNEAGWVLERYNEDDREILLTRKNLDPVVLEDPPKRIR